MWVRSEKGKGRNVKMEKKKMEYQGFFSRDGNRTTITDYGRCRIQDLLRVRGGGGSCERHRTDLSGLRKLRGGTRRGPPPVKRKESVKYRESFLEARTDWVLNKPKLAPLGGPLGPSSTQSRKRLRKKKRGGVGKYYGFEPLKKKKFGVEMSFNDTRR